MTEIDKLREALAGVQWTEGRARYSYSPDEWKAATMPPAMLALLARIEALEAERDAAQAEVGRMSERLEFHFERAAQREQRLWQWAHEELSEELKTRYFNIVANGTADVMEQPVYAQQFNMMKHRAESAEAERDAAVAARKAAQVRQEELTAEVVRLEPMRQRAADIQRIKEARDALANFAALLEEVHATAVYVGAGECSVPVELVRRIDAAMGGKTE